VNHLNYRQINARAAPKIPTNTSCHRLNPTAPIDCRVATIPPALVGANHDIIEVPGEPAVIPAGVNPNKGTAIYANNIATTKPIIAQIMFFEFKSLILKTADVYARDIEVKITMEIPVKLFHRKDDIDQT
jgi:hypothetical protein